jgi:hypothetical protein
MACGRSKIIPIIMLWTVVVTCYFAVSALTTRKWSIGFLSSLPQLHRHSQLPHVSTVELTWMTQLLTYLQDQVRIDKTLPVDNNVMFSVHLSRNVTNCAAQLRIVENRTRLTAQGQKEGAEAGVRNGTGNGTGVVQKGEGGAARGGASFKIVARGERHLFVNSYTDNFDGTYDAEVILRDALTSIDVYVIFTDFSAFRSNGSGYNTRIWSQNVLMATDNCPSLSLVTYKGWYRSSRDQPWAWLEGVSDSGQLQPMAEERNDDNFNVMDLNKCFLQTKVDFIGDSHTRYIYFYGLQLLDRLTPDVAHMHKNFSAMAVGTWRYYLTAHTLPWDAMNKVKDKPTTPPFHRGRLSFVNVSTSWLAELLAERQQSAIVTSSMTSSHRSRVLVIGAGTWDLAHWTVRNAVSYSLPALSNFLLTLRAHDLFNIVRVVVLNLPPMPEHTFRLDHRNNALIGAYNGLLAKSLSDLDLDRKHVTLVDFFSMALGRSGESPDGGHYLEIAGNSGNVTMRGEVGKIVAKQVFRHICNP